MAIINGTDGNDQIQGTSENDIINALKGDDDIHAGQGDDVVNAGDGNDVLHGGIGNNILNGGRGGDTFVLKVHPGTTTIIEDFEVNHAKEKIDISHFGNIRYFSDLNISQQGNDTQIDLGANQKILLKNIQVKLIKSSHFIGTWSANREIHIFKVGSKLDKQFAQIPDSVKNDFKKYIIQDISTFENYKNSDPHKPWLKIDLSNFGLSSIQLTQKGTSTLVDLGNDITLEVQGITPDKLDIQRNFILSKKESDTWKNELTKDWDKNAEVAVIPIKMKEDEIIPAEGIITYVSNPTTIHLINKTIGLGNQANQIYKIESLLDKLLVIDTFNPDNPLQLIDLTNLNIDNFENLGVAIQGNDSVINIGDGKSVVIKNVHPNQLKPSNFIGFKNPINKETIIYVVQSRDEVTTINDFNLAHSRLDLTDFAELNNLNDLTIQQENNNTVISIKNSQKRIVVLEEIDAWRIGMEHFIKDTPHNKREEDNLNYLVFKSYTQVFLEASGNITPLGRVVADITDSNALKPVIKIAIKDIEVSSEDMNQFQSFISNSHPLDAFQSFVGTFNDKFFDPKFLQGYIDKNIEFINTNKNFFLGNKFLHLGLLEAIGATSEYRQQYLRLSSAFENLNYLDIDQKRSIAHEGALLHTLVKLDIGLAAGQFGFDGAAALGSRISYFNIPATIFAGFGGAVALSVAASSAYTTFGQNIVDQYLIFSRLGVQVQNLKELNRFSNTGGLYKTPLLPWMHEVNNPYAIDSEKLFEASKNIADGQSIIFEGKKYTKEDGLLIGKEEVETILPDSQNEIDHLYEFYKWQEFKLSIPEGALGFHEGILYRKINGNMVEIDLLDQSADINKIYHHPEVETPSLETAPKILPIIKDLQALLEAEINALAKDLNTDIRENPVLAALLADVIQGKRLEEAVVVYAQQFARTTIGKLTYSAATKGVDSFVDIDKFIPQINTYSHNLAINLVGRLATGQLNLDSDFGREISLFSASYAVNGIVGNTVSSLVNTGITNTLSSLLGIVSTGFPIVGQIAAILVVGLIMNKFGEQVIEAWDKVADIAEDIWDFVRDPINGLEDLWDKWKDDKWTYRIGSAGPDIMHTDTYYENVKMGDGDDVFVGYNGWSLVFAGRGHDILFGGNGTLTKNYIRPDEFYGELGNDYLFGGGGGDVLIGNGGDDYIYGGSGDDIIYGDDMPNDPHGVVTDQPGSDHLYGGQGKDRIFGGPKTDWLFGGEDADHLDGEEDDDYLDGGPGPDVLHGGSGIDTAMYQNSKTGVRVNLANGTGFGGDAEGDILVDIENVIGSDFDDQIIGNDKNNVIRSGPGNDYIFAGPGDDDIHGGKGNDELHAGKGNDILNGGIGNNILTGGQGSDIFIITPNVNGFDVITDFNIHDPKEKIDLSKFPGCQQEPYNAEELHKLNLRPSRDGLSTVIDLGNGQKVILKNVKFESIKTNNAATTSHFGQTSHSEQMSTGQTDVTTSEVDSSIKLGPNNVIEDTPISPANHLSNPFSYIKGIYRSFFSEEQQISPQAEQDIALTTTYKSEMAPKINQANPETNFNSRTEHENEANFFNDAYENFKSFMGVPKTTLEEQVEYEHFNFGIEPTKEQILSQHINRNSTLNEKLTVGRYLLHYAKKWSYFTLPWNIERSVSENEKELLKHYKKQISEFKLKWNFYKKLPVAEIELFKDRFQIIQNKIKKANHLISSILKKDEISDSQLSELERIFERIEENFNFLTEKNTELEQFTRLDEELLEKDQITGLKHAVKIHYNAVYGTLKREVVLLDAQQEPFERDNFSFINLNVQKNGVSQDRILKNQQTFFSAKELPKQDIDIFQSAPEKSSSSLRLAK